MLNLSLFFCSTQIATGISRDWDGTLPVWRIFCFFCFMTHLFYAYIISTPERLMHSIMNWLTVVLNPSNIHTESLESERICSVPTMYQVRGSEALTVICCATATCIFFSSSPIPMWNQILINMLSPYDKHHTSINQLLHECVRENLQWKPAYLFPAISWQITTLSLHQMGYISDLH